MRTLLLTVALALAVAVPAAARSPVIGRWTGVMSEHVGEQTVRTKVALRITRLRTGAPAGTSAFALCRGRLTLVAHRAGGYAFTERPAHGSRCRPARRIVVRAQGARLGVRVTDAAGQTTRFTLGRA